MADVFPVSVLMLPMTRESVLASIAPLNVE